MANKKKKHGVKFLTNKKLSLIQLMRFHLRQIPLIEWQSHWFNLDRWKYEFSLLRKRLWLLFLFIFIEYFHVLTKSIAYYRHEPLGALKDVGFDIIPLLEPEYHYISEILTGLYVGVSVAFIFCLPFYISNPKYYFFTIGGRFALTMIISTFLRCITFLCTSLPGPHANCHPNIAFDNGIIGDIDKYNPPTSFNDAIHFERLNLHQSCGDLMFSGHTLAIMSFFLNVRYYLRLQVFGIGVVTRDNVNLPVNFNFNFNHDHETNVSNLRIKRVIDKDNTNINGKEVGIQMTNVRVALSKEKEKEKEFKDLKLHDTAQRIGTMEETPLLLDGSANIDDLKNIKHVGVASGNLAQRNVEFNRENKNHFMYEILYYLIVYGIYGVVLIAIVLLIIAARKHYTIDVFMALYVTPMVFHATFAIMSDNFDTQVPLCCYNEF